MSKINVLTKIPDYEGKPSKEIDQDGKIVGDLNWRKVIFLALNAMSGDPNEKQTNDDKMKCYELTQRIFQSEEVDLSLEEKAFILEKVKKIYSPLICGRTSELFEDKNDSV